MKSIRGITLVALVITIIVLLILTGITISTLTSDNGIIQKALLSKENTNYAQAEEKVKLAVLGSYDEERKINKEYLKENINQIDGLTDKITEIIEFPIDVIVDNYKFTILETGIVKYAGKNTNSLPENTEQTEAGTEVTLDETWKAKTIRYIDTIEGTEIKEVTEVATVYAIATGKGEKVPVPYDFYYVGGTIDSGVVISDNKNDKNKYKGQEIVGRDLEGNQFVWIPCTEEDYKKNDWGYANSSWDILTNSAELTRNSKIWRILLWKI